MLHKTKGIVFHTVKYSDSSIIAKIYTEQFGLRSYMIRGISSRRSKSKAAFLQHLSILNLEVYENHKKNIQNIREMEAAYHFNSIPFNIEKSSILLFINEILIKSIVEEEPNEALFNFIQAKVLQLDGRQRDYQDFHLRFLGQMIGFLGFSPGNSYSEKNEYFDLQEGVFIPGRPFHNNYLEPEQALKFSLLLSENEPEIRICNNARERNDLLSKLVDYYHLHIEGFGDIKSHEILKQIF